MADTRVEEEGITQAEHLTIFRNLLILTHRCWCAMVNCWETARTNPQPLANRRIGEFEREVETGNKGPVVVYWRNMKYFP